MPPMCQFSRKVQVDLSESLVSPHRRHFSGPPNHFFFSFGRQPPTSAVPVNVRLLPAFATGLFRVKPSDFGNEPRRRSSGPFLSFRLRSFGRAPASPSFFDVGGGRSQKLRANSPIIAPRPIFSGAYWSRLLLDRPSPHFLLPQLVF